MVKKKINLDTMMSSTSTEIPNFIEYSKVHFKDNLGKTILYKDPNDVLKESEALKKKYPKHLCKKKPCDRVTCSYCRETFFNNLRSPTGYFGVLLSNIREVQLRTLRDSIAYLNLKLITSQDFIDFSKPLKKKYGISSTLSEQEMETAEYKQFAKEEYKQLNKLQKEESAKIQELHAYAIKHFGETSQLDPLGNLGFTQISLNPLYVEQENKTVFDFLLSGPFQFFAPVQFRIGQLLNKRFELIRQQLTSSAKSNSTQKSGVKVVSAAPENDGKFIGLYKKKYVPPEKLIPLVEQKIYERYGDVGDEIARSQKEKNKLPDDLFDLNPNYQETVYYNLTNFSPRKSQFDQNRQIKSPCKFLEKFDSTLILNNFSRSLYSSCFSEATFPLSIINVIPQMFGVFICPSTLAKNSFLDFLSYYYNIENEFKYLFLSELRANAIPLFEGAFGPFTPKEKQLQQIRTLVQEIKKNSDPSVEGVLENDVLDLNKPIPPNLSAWDSLLIFNWLILEAVLVTLLDFYELLINELTQNDLGLMDATLLSKDPEFETVLREFNFHSDYLFKDRQIKLPSINKFTPFTKACKRNFTLFLNRFQSKTTIGFACSPHCLNV